MAYLQEGIGRSLGNRVWFGITEIVADNGWISLLAVKYLKGERPLVSSFENGVHTASLCVALATCSWIIRYGVSKNVPLLAPYLGTRSCEQG